MQRTDYRESILSWGVFKLENGSLTYEIVEATETFPVATREGRLLNDSTIQIDISYELKRKKKKRGQYTVDKTYYFRQFRPKPDSTNRFVK